MTIAFKTDEALTQLDGSESYVHIMLPAANEINDAENSSGFYVDDENASDCSDDDEEIETSNVESVDGSPTVSIRRELPIQRAVMHNRLSSRFLPLKDVDIDRKIDLSDVTLIKIGDIIANFPTPPTHIPRGRENVTPTYSAAAALKAVSFGFGSLKRGVDKLGIFSPKK